MTGTVTVRYFAGAHAARGLAEEQVDLAGLADPRPTIDTLAGMLADRHGPALTRVLAVSSFLLDEVAGGRGRPLHDGAQVDVLPPFAGG